MPTLRIKVKPGTRRSQLTLQEDGIWLAELKSPPVDGKANAELIELISKRFGCRKTDIWIKSGAGSRLKIILISE